MALWKEPTAGSSANPTPANPPPREPVTSTVTPMSQELPRRTRERTDAKESLIAADLTIEGKIEGSASKVVDQELTGIRICLGHCRGDRFLKQDNAIKPR